MKIQKLRKAPHKGAYFLFVKSYNVGISDLFNISLIYFAEPVWFRMQSQ